ncbi:MAG: hypothetical protein RL375_4632, partial [Pseudomonadota bacterium]
ADASTPVGADGTDHPSAGDSSGLSGRYDVWLSGVQLSGLT